MLNARRVVVLAVAVAAVASFASAQGLCNGPQTETLIAGQNFYAGTVTVTLEGAKVCVTYQTDPGWVLTETHLAIATSLAGIPQTKSGNPQPGQFPYSSTHTPPVTMFQYCVPNPASDSTQQLYIATHAVVQQVNSSGAVIQRQTAWSGPDGFPGKNWATYFTVPYCPYAED